MFYGISTTYYPQHGLSSVLVLRLSCALLTLVFLYHSLCNDQTLLHYCLFVPTVQLRLLIDTLLNADLRGVKTGSESMGSGFEV